MIIQSSFLSVNLVSFILLPVVTSAYLTKCSVLYHRYHFTTRKPLSLKHLFALYSKSEPLLTALLPVYLSETLNLSLVTNVFFSARHTSTSIS